MLEDEARMRAFREAILEVVAHGDVVLDAGAGTGILSFFAMEAGAKRVYAVERTRVARLARELVSVNPGSDSITLIEANLEDVELPEQVDVIITELLGGYGVDENMLVPLLTARDRWLRAEGRKHF